MSHTTLAASNTVYIVEYPPTNPDDRTVTKFVFDGPLDTVQNVTIAVSRAVELPLLIEHLQSMWDRAKKIPAQDDHERTVNERAL
jgi:hypothetical protein